MYPTDVIIKVNIFLQVNIKGKHGRTALYLAAEGKHEGDSLGFEILDTGDKVIDSFSQSVNVCWTISISQNRS